MSLKTYAAIIILLALVAVLAVITINQKMTWDEMVRTQEAEALEARINGSFNDGYESGMRDGVIETFRQVYSNGVISIMADEQTYTLYSPQGCVDAILGAA